MAAKKTNATRGRPVGTVIAGSMTDRLVKLEVGEAESRVREITGKRGATLEDASEIRRTLVSTITPQIARVTERYTDRAFEIDTGVIVTNGNALYVVCCIKRVK
jgi:hypothetical protein